MPTTTNKTHFASGPAGLPPSVLESCAAAFLNFNNTSLGLAEHSHRSASSTAIVEDTKASLASFLKLPLDQWDVLFMQAGGTGQFSGTVYGAVNVWVARKKKQLEDMEKDASVVTEKLATLVEDRLKLDYIVTGRWSDKASKEACRLVGEERVNVVANSHKDGMWKSIPEESSWKLSDDAAMVYYCDNETVDGVEFPGFPAILQNPTPEKEPERIVVADMSSNILTRRIPWESLSIVFFGAQKNLGITGVTVALVRKSLLALSEPEPKLLRKLGLPVVPVVMSYNTMSKNNSLYNTLSIFEYVSFSLFAFPLYFEAQTSLLTVSISVFVAGEMLKYLHKTHAPDLIASAESFCNNKASLVYNTIAAHPARYSVIPEAGARSRTNICFRILDSNGNNDENAEKTFVAQAEQLGLTGLKGHRSMGGIRVGNFNGVTTEGTETLVKLMTEFAGRQD